MIKRTLSITHAAVPYSILDTMNLPVSGFICIQFEVELRGIHPHISIAHIIFPISLHSVHL